MLASFAARATEAHRVVVGPSRLVMDHDADLGR
jgi:hypothetical protein